VQLFREIGLLIRITVPEHPRLQLCYRACLDMHDAGEEPTEEQARMARFMLAQQGSGFKESAAGWHTGKC
jgi:hypothetical protein